MAVRLLVAVVVGLAAEGQGRASPLASLGVEEVVCSFSPGHGEPEHRGAITIINPNGGPDAQPYARRISREATFHDPYPLSEDAFLVAQGERLLLMNGAGEAEVLYELPAGDRLDLHEPMPLRPRPRELIIPPRVRSDASTGRLVVVNVAHGRNMAGVGPGEVKRLLVLEQLAKPVNFSGGMEPLTLNGAFTLKRILGTVPVEPDGSANFEVPALRSIFFVALDERDLSVKRMQSFVTVQPGETTSCAGCHESRANTPLTPPEGLMALRRPPSRIEPVPDAPEIFDFPRDIQPLLDKHCLKCHDAEPHGADGPRAGGVVLAGDRGPMYSHSYYTLMSRPGLVSHGQDSVGNRPPRAIGSSASRLLKLLESLLRAKAGLDRMKRFDMPGFRPNDHYLREMKRYGILPATLGPADPVDPYAADQAYWRSFWHHPAAWARTREHGQEPRTFLFPLPLGEGRVRAPGVGPPPCFRSPHPSPLPRGEGAQALSGGGGGGQTRERRRRLKTPVATAMIGAANERRPQ